MRLLRVEQIRWYRPSEIKDDDENMCEINAAIIIKKIIGFDFDSLVEIQQEKKAK